MKLTFRDLKQQKFVIEAEPSESIGAVKEKISQEKGWDAATQKLIYSGKILQDANTVESYNIEEKGFIVCMISKPKATTSSGSTSKAPVTPAPASVETPAAPAAPAPATITSTSNAPATPSPAPTGTTTAATTETGFTESSMLVGNQSQGAIAEMEAMGFERSQIDRAMRAAFYNPDRAIEYLLNGIPESTEQPARPPSQGAGGAGSPPAPAAATTQPAAGSGDGGDGGDQPINLFEAAAQAGQQGGGATGGRGRGAAGLGGLGALGANLGAGAGAGGEGAGQTLEFLRNNPHFQQLRQLVQQQPQMLEPILQQVGAGNPQLAALIGQNQQEFLQLLSEDLDDDAPMPPGAQTISVTEEERDAIERLCRLGFSRDQVIQAYFACDKNEELAANFLFDQPDDGDDQ